MFESVIGAISRVIGKPPGWERVVRFLLPPANFWNNPVLEKAVPDGYVFPIDPRTLIGWNIYLFGTYESEVREAINTILAPGDVACDVGANVGWHTLLMARLVGPTGKVYAFEPNPTTRTRLSDAVRLNAGSHIDVQEYAVTDYDGMSGFVAPPAGSLWDGTGRLVNDRVSEVQSVKCTTIDSFVHTYCVTRLRLIKIDVEGWELSVMRGARQALATMRPRIIFEYDPAYVSRGGGTADDILSFLFENRYGLCMLRRHGVPLPINQLPKRCWNFLAVPLEINGRPVLSQRASGVEKTP